MQWKLLYHTVEFPCSVVIRQHYAIVCSGRGDLVGCSGGQEVAMVYCMPLIVVAVVKPYLVHHSPVVSRVSRC